MNEPAGLGRCRPRLIVMVKEPLMGRVKTRLARDCGAARATNFLRTCLAVTLQRLAADTRWHTMLAVAPDSAVKSPMFPSQVARLPQGGGDLGDRLARVARNAPAGPLIVIGADIPAIATRDIAAAFAVLRSNDVVFGPAGDGGYWLVGLSPRARRLASFDNVRWSTPHALADTLANLSNCKVTLIGAKDDVDEAAGLVRLGARAQRLIV